MKISLSWLSDYIKVEQSAEELADILTEIGLEVEGIEKHESVKGGLAGVVIGEVVECGKHPNADRLSLTKVNIGAEELLQIVCGAPNVAAGQMVPVATVGTILYDKEGESFKIKKGKIRGEVSEGMICAEDELSLGDSHDGIMVLDPNTQVGTLAKDYFELQDDTVLEIALTPNRSDATCHIGVAKDLAAALKINYGHEGAVAAPSVEAYARDPEELPIEVSVENHKACPRYAGVCIDQIEVKPSPEWLQQKLSAIGVRPINNVVDITNFVLHELGQPLHAFDYDQIQGAQVVVKTLAKDTLFKSLDEVDRKLHPEDLMICDGENNGMCIGGVFGGINSGVSDRTARIFLESAHFNPRWIRRSSGRHLLFTDAAKVFEKGSDPNLCVYALKRAALLIRELAGGRIVSDIIDIYPEPVEAEPISLSYVNLNRLVGTPIEPVKVKSILEAQEVNVLQEDANGLTVQFPTNKVDVLREADVIEEVLRIYGFNNIPFPGKMNIGVSPSPKIDSIKIRTKVSDLLVGQGFTEAMGLSLVRQDYFEKVMPIEEDALVRINNTSNTSIEIMRPNLLISALEMVIHNHNRQQEVLRLFEFGHAYARHADGYKESSRLSLTMTGGNAASWLRGRGHTQEGYFRLKGLVELILSTMGVARIKGRVVQDEYFGYGMTYELGKNELVRFGVVDSGLLNRMGVKGEVLYADFDWGTLLKMSRIDTITTKESSKFPSVRRDLALVVDQDVQYTDLAREIGQVLRKNLVSVDLFDVYQDEKLKSEGKKSYAISMILEDPAKTFSDQEIDRLMQMVLKKLEEKFSASLR